MPKEDILGKKQEKAKSDKKKVRKGDTAHALLDAVVGRAEGGSDVASLCRAADSSLSDVLRGLLDLQRFGLIEVTNGTSRPTPLGSAALKALAGRPGKT